MININSLKIDELSTKIDVDIATSIGHKITKVLLWTEKTFKDYSKAIDLSDLLKKINEKESFTITNTKLSLTNITGLFFLEFTSDETSTTTNPNQVIGITSNFIKYHECLLSNVINCEINNCDVYYTSLLINNCNVYYTSMLINSLNIALKLRLYEEAIKIITTLDDICEVCTTCPDYTVTKLISGLGFGTVNNSIVLI